MSLKNICYLLVAAATLVATALLGGCRVGYPFRGPGYDVSRGVVHPEAGEQVYVAITQGDVDSKNGGRFSEQLKLVMDSMGEHDGLIGYAVRKELFGSRVWTMSAWVNRESMERFVRSPAHRSAMKHGAISRGSFIAAFVYMDAARVPLGWSEAEELLQEQGKGK